MAKTYIGKALCRLSKVPNPDGKALCDQIANQLTQMTSGAVKTVDSALNFGWLAYQTHGVHLGGMSAAEVADKRRAAMILSLVNIGPVSPGDAVPDSWEDMKLSAYIRRHQGNARKVTGSGYYLKGSFWAFASHNEREWTKQSWNEGLRMLDAGISVMGRAVGGHTTAADLARRWFGTTAPRALHERLQALRLAVGTSRIGIGYHGTGALNPGKYIEEGSGVIATTLAQLDSEWGFASPSHAAHNNLGFGARFFNPGETAISRSEVHTISVRGVMEVTRGGAIVHELSHRYLRTDDQEVPNEVYEFADRPIPAPGVSRAKGYGPFTCFALAFKRPELAANNADNFRLFCEDALLIS